MADKRWKQFERIAADLIHGKRYWANSGEAIDCESDEFVAQCKLVQRLSLVELSGLCQVAADQGKAKGKVGVVVTKVAKRQLPTVISMTADQFESLTAEQPLSDLQTCTRLPPHICKVNGPCNGLPRDRPPRWNEIQKGMPLEKMKLLDDLAHGLVTKEALAWVCELIAAASRGI